MKKNSLSILLILTLTLWSYTASSQDVSLGAKAGLNISTIGGDSDGVSAKAGIHLGAFAQVGEDRFKFQPELIYSQQGAAIDGDGNAKVRYNYLNIPLIAKFYPVAGEGFNVQAGPQLGFMLVGELSNDDVDIDIKDDLNTVDFALGFGVGYDVQKFVIDARYNLGLSSTAEDDSFGDFPMRTFQFSVGYKFL
ncbi:MAG: porin family protein [Bacteroidota bacterium]